MNETVLPLLRTPGPEDNESFLGYLLRLCEKNYRRSPIQIIRLTQVRLRGDMRTTFRFVFRADMLASFADLTRCSVAELKKLQHPSLREKMQSYGRGVARSQIRLKYPKVCARCLQESAHCRRAWDFAALTVCLAHRCKLLDQCPNCKLRLTWTRSSVTHCPCGFDWRTAETNNLEEQDFQLALLLARHWNLPASSRISIRNNPLASLTLKRMLSTLYFIAEQYSSGKMIKGPLINQTVTNSQLHELLVRSFNVYQNWPLNYQKFLDWKREKYPASLDLDKPGSKIGQKAFTSKSSAVLQALLARSYNAAPYDPLDEDSQKRKPKGRPVAPPRRPGLPLYIVIAELGLNYSALNRYMKFGKLNSRVERCYQRRSILIDARDVLALRREFKSYLSLDQVAAMLGITPTYVQELVQYNCLTPSRGPTIDGFRHLMFQPAEIHEFLHKIGKAIRAARLGKAAQQNKIISEFLGKCGPDDASVGPRVKAILDGTAG